MMAGLFNNAKSFGQVREWLVKDSGSVGIYNWFHRGLGLVYLVALVPMFIEAPGLIGENGLLPAPRLLDMAYQGQGVLSSLWQFPSLYHIFPSDITLYALIATGCIGALMLVAGIRVFLGALLAWISFLSITNVGGDFYIIIIDFFLSEVGFLALFSTWFLQYYKAIPNLVDFAFRMLNFRLWFCMGVNKFYMPLDVWADFSFFDYFFFAQPMPTPVAWYFNQVPDFLKYVAQVGLFIGEIIIPFFVFGKRWMRILSFITFFLISFFIQLNGNYGYFNVLSVVAALLILKKGDLKWLPKSISGDIKQLKIPVAVSIFVGINLAYQALYSITVFDPTPYSYQNHFNHTFLNWKPESKLADKAMEIFRWPSYWRICSPTGVFKGIPRNHAELRFSASIDGDKWTPYQFKFLPSSYTDYLGFYAPYYPRLDHLMFYEGLGESGFKYNPLNPYYTADNAWICAFVDGLFENNNKVTRLLKNTPYGDTSPKYIRVEVYRLRFSMDIKDGAWVGEKVPIERVYEMGEERKCQPILSIGEASFLLEE